MSTPGSVPKRVSGVKGASVGLCVWREVGVGVGGSRWVLVPYEWPGRSQGELEVEIGRSALVRTALGQAQREAAGGRRRLSSLYRPSLERWLSRARARAGRLVGTAWYKRGASWVLVLVVGVRPSGRLDALRRVYPRRRWFAVRPVAPVDGGDPSVDVDVPYRQLEAIDATEGEGLLSPVEAESLRRAWGAL